MRPMDLYHEKTMLRPLESKPLYLVLAWLRESRPAAYYMLIETARAGIDCYVRLFRKDGEAKMTTTPPDGYVLLVRRDKTNVYVGKGFYDFFETEHEVTISVDDLSAELLRTFMNAGFEIVRSRKATAVQQ